MDFKRILRAPLFWVVAVIAITLMVFSLSDAGGYTRIDTSAAQQLITEKKVERAVVTNNEVVDLDLKKGETYSDGKNVKDATKVRTQYVEAAGPDASSSCSRTTRRPAASTRSSRTPTRCSRCSARCCRSSSCSACSGSS